MNFTHAGFAPSAAQKPRPAVRASGATNATHNLSAADVDHALRVVVTGTNAAGSSDATSAASGAVAPAPPVNTVLPVISGTLRDGADAQHHGRYLDRHRADLLHLPVAPLRRGRARAAPTSPARRTPRYTLVAADVGHALRVVVTATNVAGDASATSAASAEVAAGAAGQHGAAGDLGHAAWMARRVSTTNGTWTGTAPISYTYQWRRCDVDGANCADIAGATNSTLQRSSAADVDHDAARRRDRHERRRQRERDVSARATRSLPAPPVNTVPPVISGTLRTARRLSTTNGTWTGTAPISYTYQWRLCDSDGANCSDIAGETDPTYNVVPADVGHDAARRRHRDERRGQRERHVGARATRSLPAPPVNTVPPVISGTLRGRRDGEHQRTARGPAPRRSPTPTSGSAATPTAITAWTSLARRTRRTTCRPRTSIRRCAPS